MAEAVEKHVFAGIQFPGRRAVGEILKEVERQKVSRKDVLLTSDKLSLAVRDNQLLMKVPYRGSAVLAPMTKRVHVQLASWLGIRMTDRFYKWMMEHAESWAKTVNEFMGIDKTPKLVRMMDDANQGTTYVRALLSDKYRIISNADFFFAIAEAMRDSKVELWHARLSEDNFYVYGVAPGIAGQVSTDRAFDPGDGWKSRWYGKENDVFNAAMAAGNSETGEGGCWLAQAILRRVCENYCVWHDVVNKTHIGKRNRDDLLLSDETLAEMNRVFFLQLRDYTKSTFDPVQFQKFVDQLNSATKDVVEDPEVAAEALQFTYNLSEERKAAIRNLFIRSNDCSRYGLLNAVNEYAHDDKMSADEGFELERLSAALMETDMTAIYKKAEKVKADKAAKTDVKQVAVATVASARGEALMDL